MELSVIIPVYNAGEYLEKCIESVLSQDYENFELILVDDGSKDQSPELCDSFLKDSRVKVIHQENMGHTRARNRGLSEALGSYVFLMDADDYIDDGMFSHMMGLAVRDNLDIVHCNYRSVKNEKTSEVICPVGEGVYDREAIDSKVWPQMIWAGGYYKFGIAPNMWHQIYRKSLIEDKLKTIPIDIKSGEDGLLNYMAFRDAERICFVKEAYYNYRSLPESMCRIKDDSRIGEVRELMEAYEKLFLKGMSGKREDVIRPQLQRMELYLTLQAIEWAISPDKRSDGLRVSIGEIVKKYPFLKRKDDSNVIKNLPLAFVKGKKNKLIFLYLKMAALF